VKIVRFSTGDMVQYGVIEGDMIRGFRGSPYPDITGRISSFEDDGSSYTLEAVKLLAPCTPSKLVCLGLNYRSHAEEGKLDVPQSPIIFIKPSTAVIGPEDNIILPPGSRRVDYEAELGVVIGKTARFVTEGDAFNYVLGYTCVNDVTERYNQRDDGQWTRAKSYDTFAPLGPCIDTDVDPGNVLVETYLNGKLRQSARTGELIFKIPYLVHFITNVMTLLPGDVIATGTMAGIGRMDHGDLVEVKIEKIGTLRNHVVSGN
jgi:2-keto-4-pentenoate hydratase/2-oxohepta-3-ene-1,7-dioic acid hydratase in catechol pathway